MTRTDIRGLVDTTPTIELPLLIGELEAAKAAAWTRLNAQVDCPVTCEAQTLVQRHIERTRIGSKDDVPSRISVGASDGRKK